MISLSSHWFFCLLCCPAAAAVFRTLKEDGSEVPRLPDPNLVFPPTPRHRCAPERPKTLDFLARPRPSPRTRCDVFPVETKPMGTGLGLTNGESSIHTSSTETPPIAEFGRDQAVPLTPTEGPTPFSPHRSENLLDHLDKEQCQDGTVPLCRTQTSLHKDSDDTAGFWS